MTTALALSWLVLIIAGLVGGTVLATTLGCWWVEARAARRCPHCGPVLPCVECWTERAR